MGACASFPKGMNEDARKAPPPEQPKEEVDPATASAVADGEKEIKVDDKTLGTFFKEEKMEEAKTTVTEEEKTSITEKPLDDSPEIIEATPESPLPVSDGKVEISTSPVASVTSDGNKGITEVKQEKK